ncbi:MAG: hypothetical protein HXS46_04770 [Theionarchaea archaeon]|nr:hypothetical protein [Theionarchaea archaeon]
MHVFKKEWRGITTEINCKDGASPSYLIPFGFCGCCGCCGCCCFVGYVGCM